MNPSEYGRAKTIEISFGELTGALGDSVTVFPVVVAIGALTELSLAHLLLGFAAFQVVWGLYYGLPVSVEPMKALAALVIAGSLTAGELAAAGLLAGVVLLVVGTTGTLGHVTRFVGQPLVRGVQVAVGLILLETGVHLSLGNVPLALLAAGVAAVAVLAGYRRASALVVLCVGVGVAVLQSGVPAPAVPSLAVGLPGPEAVSIAALEGTLAQLAMTVGNAAVATSLLLSDYYDADVSADELATSMGAMNLVAIPLGAMPMCHGSGGVAGKYAFGARTAGSNLILGAIYAVAAVIGVGVVAAFPLPMLGVVLALIAVELVRAGLDTEWLSLTVGVGLLGLVTNVGVAFLAGTIGYLLLDRYVPLDRGR
ncbi:sulfate transporter [Halorubrum sp. CBA1125]|uniref:putative sulfate/molybdate transporter n=1 Tax=Halorubrum sp. CBA1125 TaxID=2668072 RepID=UPI00135F0BCE|nr:putative sulfate/molybdate transporter [Halorubrum sp. CBA1125]MUW13660.1 sulfate transporter [Halorubrum sp. CBA1125]